MTGLTDEEAAYKQGVRDGKISALEKRADISDQKHVSHENRFKYVERLFYMFGGALFVVQFYPSIKAFFL